MNRELSVRAIISIVLAIARELDGVLVGAISLMGLMPGHPAGYRLDQLSVPPLAPGPVQVSSLSVP